jgi:Ser/Thr protein kinase RdoA (MazF antagonist)
MNPDTPERNLRSIAGAFRLYGDFRGGAPYGTGHINDTYAAVYDQSGSAVRYILQRINHHVFKDPPAVMENITRVTAHLHRKLEEARASEVSRRVLTLVPTVDGQMWTRTASGNWWRCYLFIEKARSYDQIENAEQAFQAARAFGEFQKLLADLPAPRLLDTIPDFHNARQRFEALRAAIQTDACNRAAGVKSEIQFCFDREGIIDVLPRLQARGLLPERVTHNDTKLNNVMIDDASGEGICVIDLDTVMPGLILYDFGDLCRSGTRPTAEDERDLSKVEMRHDLFEALVRGYVASAGAFINQAEKDHLAFAAGLITFEIGMRFLTDHLQGDCYFKTHRPDHNADRARVQFKMVESFEQNERAMRRVVQDAFT